MGLQNAAFPKPDQIHLLAQVRRATISDQNVLLGWLLKKFKLIAISAPRAETPP